jgi:hypothetical protein
LDYINDATDAVNNQNPVAVSSGPVKQKLNNMNPVGVATSATLKN